MAFRREIPKLITSVLVAVIIIQYFFGFGTTGNYVVNTLSEINVLLVMIAVGLGMTSIAAIHIKRIINKVPGQWPYSIILLASMLGYLLLGLITSPKSDVYNWWYIAGPRSIELTARALPLFLSATATYRAFRLRTWNSYVIMISFVLVALGLAPIIESVAPWISDIRTWIVTSPSVAGQRAILVGGAVGAISLGLRTIIGREEGVMGGE